MTSNVLRPCQWLTERKVTHVALESTGVYWQPIYGLLEGHFELLLVNAQHIKAVPGRKTGVRDAEWLADLLQHGLLRASFVPPLSQRHVRELTRYRTSLSEERSRAVNRLQKILEGATNGNGGGRWICHLPRNSESGRRCACTKRLTR